MPSREGEVAGPDPQSRGSVTNGRFNTSISATSQIRTRESGVPSSPVRLQIFPCITARRAHDRQHVEEGQTAPLCTRRLHANWRLPTASMMPFGSPVFFTSFTKLADIEDVLRLQVPAPDLTAFDVCPSNMAGCRPFVCIDGQIALLVLV